MPTLQENPDGKWVEAEPLGPQTGAAVLEQWFRKRGFNRVADLLGRFDEKGL